MSVTNYLFSGGQPLLPPPLFQQLWSKHGKTHSKTGYCLQQSRPKKYSDGEGLYFCVCKQGSPYWMIRYTSAKGRREPLKARVAEVKASMPNSNAIADIEREIAIYERYLGEFGYHMFVLRKGA